MAAIESGDVTSTAPADNSESGWCFICGSILEICSLCCKHRKINYLAMVTENFRTSIWGRQLQGHDHQWANISWEHEKETKSCTRSCLFLSVLYTHTCVHAHRDLLIGSAVCTIIFGLFAWENVTRYRTMWYPQLFGVYVNSECRSVTKTLTLRYTQKPCSTPNIDSRDSHYFQICIGYLDWLSWTWFWL